MWICVNICCENIRISVCMHGAQVCEYAFLQTISHNSCIFMHVNCAEFMLINTAELRSTCIYAKSMQKPCTNSMCMCTRMHAFSSAALSSVHIFKKCTYSHVCVCARACVIKLEWWQGWSVWGGETCSIYSCCCKCWSWLCKPAMHAAVSPTSICVYECIFTHIHVCVCVCVYRHTHKQMEGSERRRV